MWNYLFIKNLRFNQVYHPVDCSNTSGNERWVIWTLADPPSNNSFCFDCSFKIGFWCLFALLTEAEAACSAKIGVRQGDSHVQSWGDEKVLIAIFFSTVNLMLRWSSTIPAWGTNTKSNRIMKSLSQKINGFCSLKTFCNWGRKIIVLSKQSLICILIESFVVADWKLSVIDDLQYGVDDG